MLVERDRVRLRPKTLEIGERDPFDIHPLQLSASRPDRSHPNESRRPRVGLGIVRAADSSSAIAMVEMIATVGVNSDPARLRGRRDCEAWRRAVTPR